MSEKIFYIGSFGEKVNSDDKYIKEADMFSTGVHRGVEYTEEDIDQLVETFSAEENIPVQLDHSSSVKDTVGFIRKVFSKDGKLKGNVEILDEGIQERIDKGLMNKVSVSFYLKHTEEGFKPHKLRELSLVAFPQVKGARLFSENGFVSDYEENYKEGDEMSKEQRKFSQEEVNQKVAEAENKLVEKYEALESKLDTLVEQNKKFSQQEVAHKVEKFQEEKKVVPAQAESLEKLLNSFSDEQSKLFDEFMKNNKTVDFNEHAEFEEQEHEDDKDDERTKEQKEFDAFYEEYEKKYGSSL